MVGDGGSLRSYRALLTAQLEGLRGRVVLLAVALLVGLGLQLVNPQLLRAVVDGALAGEARDDLVPLAATFVAVALVAQLLAVVTAYVAEDVGWRATNRLREQLTEHVLGLDLAFHADHPPGHLIERVDGDVTALANFFSALVVRVVGSALLVVGIVVLVARESLLLGLVVGVLSASSVLTFLRLHDVAVPWWKAVSATQAEVFGSVGELAEATEDLVPNGAADFAQERFADQLRELLPRTVRAWTGFALLWATSNTVAMLTTLAVYAVAAVQLDDGTLTVGSVFLVVYYVGMVERPLHQLRDEFTDLQKAGGAIARIGDLAAARSALSAAGDHELPGGAHDLHLDGVTFAYGDGPDVLRGLDVRVPAGRTLGLVGRTGAGKSTLAKLVVRLQDPTTGHVRLGGVPLPELSGLRGHVAMVTQDVQLFRASVRDNLALFDTGVPDDRLRAALADVGLGPWLDALPGGLDTLVDAGELSAGEAQLLALARVFLRDPGLVVLDEASSRLDPATEARLERAVDRLLDGRTAIVVAHRLGTLDRVDDVLVLEDGEVLEHGGRAALAADPSSRFARLVAAGLEEVLA